MSSDIVMKTLVQFVITRDISAVKFQNWVNWKTNLYMCSDVRSYECRDV